MILSLGLMIVIRSHFQSHSLFLILSLSLSGRELLGIASSLKLSLHFQFPLPFLIISDSISASLLSAVRVKNKM